MTGVEILVMAKSPRPGLSKTRLCPPFDPVEAAQLAEAALADTLQAAVAAGPGTSVTVHLDGEPGPWLPAGAAVMAQAAGELDQRLAHALSQHRGPVLLVGMDTPQVPARELAAAVRALREPGTDAVFGAAVDGGWWALGLREPRGGLVAGVPCSRPDTGRRQLRRLVEAGLRVHRLAVHRDVDTAEDAALVAAAAPGSRFAACLAELTRVAA